MDEDMVIQGRLSSKQHTALLKLTNCCNSTRKDTEEMSPSKVLWILVTSLLDELDRQRHNCVLGFVTENKHLR